MFAISLRNYVSFCQVAIHFARRTRQINNNYHGVHFNFIIQIYVICTGNSNYSEYLCRWKVEFNAEHIPWMAEPSQAKCC